MSAPRTDIEQVELANTAFYEALERGDFDAVSSLWLAPLETAADDIEGEGAVVSCVHPGWPVLNGRGEVLRSYALIMANTEYIQFFLTDVHVSVTGDIALVTCTENILSGGPAPRPATSSARSSASWWSPRTCSVARWTAGSSGRTTPHPCSPNPARRRTTRTPPAEDRPALCRARGHPRSGGLTVHWHQGVVGITNRWVGAATNP